MLYKQLLLENTLTQFLCSKMIKPRTERKKNSHLAA